MKIQETDYSCGAASAVNVLAFFGKTISEKTMRKRARTTKKDGTCAAGIVTALSFYRIDCTVSTFNDDSSAEEFLKNSVKSGFPLILSAQHHQHWIVLLPVISNETFVVLDPSNSFRNKKKYGVHFMCLTELMEMWKSRFTKTTPAFLAIACYKKM